MSKNSRAVSQLYNELENKHIEIPFEEDPVIKDSEKLDYYDFYHSDGITESQLKIENKYRKNDQKRDPKWKRMCDIGHSIEAHKKTDYWNKKLFINGRPVSKLKRRVFKGIPKQFRTTVWSRFLQPEKLKEKIELDYNVKESYQLLVEYAKSHAKCLGQIDKDINRTFRNSRCFRDRLGPRQCILFRLLSAYSVFNPEIEYCQGMNEIAGLLLMYIHDEEEAFWCFAQLMTGEKYRMHGMFVTNFPTLMKVLNRHDQVLKKIMPRLYNHFQSQNVQNTVYALKWYMQCFIGRVPVNLMLRLWDIFLLHGLIVLIPMGITILKMHKQSLKKMDFESILSFIQNGLTEDFGFSDDQFITELQNMVEIFHKNNLFLPLSDNDPSSNVVLGSIIPEIVKTEVWKVRNDHEAVTSDLTASPNSSTVSPISEKKSNCSSQENWVSSSLGQFTRTNGSSPFYTGATLSTRLGSPPSKINPQVITSPVYSRDLRSLEDTSSLSLMSNYSGSQNIIFQLHNESTHFPYLQANERQSSEFNYNYSSQVTPKKSFSPIVVMPPERTDAEGAEDISSSPQDLMCYEPGDKILTARKKTSPTKVSPTVILGTGPRPTSQQFREQDPIDDYKIMQGSSGNRILTSVLPIQSSFDSLDRFAPDERNLTFSPQNQQSATPTLEKSGMWISRPDHGLEIEGMLQMAVINTNARVPLDQSPHLVSVTPLFSSLGIENNEKDLYSPQNIHGQHSTSKVSFVDPDHDNSVMIISSKNPKKSNNRRTNLMDTKHSTSSLNRISLERTESFEESALTPPLHTLLSKSGKTYSTTTSSTISSLNSTSSSRIFRETSPLTFAKHYGNDFSALMKQNLKLRVRQ